MKELIDKAKKIVILTHMAPDGDAMGSALAVYHYVTDRWAVGPLCCKTANAVGVQSTDRVADRIQTREVRVIVPNMFPAFFNWMPGAAQILIYEKEPQRCNSVIAEADLFICTDFNDPKRIGPVGEKMLANNAPKILIDHHLMDRCADRAQTANADRPASPDGLWAEVHSHPEASSACEIVYRLITADDRYAVGPSPSDCKTAYAVGPQAEPAVGVLSEAIATCIYTGLMTDTGNFSFNSTNAELYDIIASLIRAGVKKDEIYNAVFNQYSTDRVRLTGYALYRKMRIYPEHHLSLITLSADEMERYHYQPGDTEGLVNMPLQIADVYYSVYMREERPKPGTPKPRIRISFRSQGDRPVNIWASEVFHGGGHMNASGGEMFGTLEQAVRLFEETYGKYIRN
ncbi:MAG: bifunctional oligoribonuclease/PAP phosphatase NrnA [Paludibacteraceae bacterium]